MDKDMRFNSIWDWSTWLFLIFVTGWIVWPILLDDGIAWRITTLLVTILFILSLVMMFKGIYYCIDGKNLVVYHFFRPVLRVPVDKIESVRHSKSILASSATSFVNRLDIRFTDCSILKSSLPLIVSPVQPSEFISRLFCLNPDIHVM